jgi:dihydroorotate dehydrogenase electron transfer subunit
MSISHRCRVVAHRHLGEDIYLLTLDLPLPKMPEGGNFLHIKVGGGTDPLLRRPFSIFDYDEEAGYTDVLYKIFGRGTALLARVQPDMELDVLGPLGNSFLDAEPERQLLLVGGGVGIPPLYLLARRMLKSGAGNKEITFLCGLANARERVMTERLEKLSLKVEFSTDDGSLGHHGLITELLQQQLDQGNRALVCACGPTGMLKRTQQLCRQYGVRCLVSLESIMPCGLGTCLGCVVHKANGDGYRRVCREGPVFSAEEVEL